MIATQITWRTRLCSRFRMWAVCSIPLYQQRGGVGLWPAMSAFVPTSLYGLRDDCQARGGRYHYQAAGARDNLIASSMFRRASSSVSPAEAQPGSSGQIAEKLPASESNSSTTRNLIASV